MRCLECKFYCDQTTDDDDAYHGECRLKAPRVFNGKWSSITAWPEVQFDDWCGKFQQNQGEVQ